MTNNNVIIIGRLGHDPELRKTRTGKSMCTFSVAVNRPINRNKGQQESVTDWFNIISWEGLAEAAGASLAKGMKVRIEGRITFDTYQAKDGSMKQSSQVTAQDILIPLEPVRQDNGAGFNRFGQAQPDRQPRRKAPDTQPDMFQQDNPPPPVNGPDGEEIPF